ncbi:hypothetical protein KAURM247S_01960 [Kitasatospora aureofaciens]
MLPMLALSNDPNIENRAHEALDALKSRAQDFKSYRVRRELLRARQKPRETHTAWRN